MSSKSQSTGKAAQKPRLSVAMDVDPTAAEEYRPVGAEVPALVEEAETPTSRPSRARKKPAANKPEPATSPSPAGRDSGSSDPAVQVVNGRTYVVSGEDLLPEASRVQMTIALTAMERHRWTRYAEARRMSLIDVLRERMEGIFSGEDE